MIWLRPFSRTFFPPSSSSIVSPSQRFLHPVPNRSICPSSSSPSLFDLSILSRFIQFIFPLVWWFGSSHSDCAVPSHPVPSVRPSVPLPFSACPSVRSSAHPFINHVNLSQTPVVVVIVDLLICNYPLEQKYHRPPPSPPPTSTWDHPGSLALLVSACLATTSRNRDHLSFPGWPHWPSWFSPWGSLSTFGPRTKLIVGIAPLPGPLLFLFFFFSISFFHPTQRPDQHPFLPISSPSSLIRRLHIAPPVHAHLSHYSSSFSLFLSHAQVQYPSSSIGTVSGTFGCRCPFDPPQRSHKTFPRT